METVTRHPQAQAMDEIRHEIESASKCFSLDLDIHCGALGRTLTDDMRAFHTRQITLVGIVRWEIAQAAREFHLTFNAIQVQPKLFGLLQACRILVTTIGSDWPAARMDADRHLSKANDKLNYLSVMMEADRAF